MKVPILVALALATAPALAGPSLTLDLGPEADVQSLRYLCDGDRSLSVQYVNTDANSLAMMTLDGGERIFVNVIAASGARYVSGAHEWWTKGDAATLTDLTGTADALDCRADPGQGR